MKRNSLLTVAALCVFFYSRGQTQLATGEQPQITADNNGTIRLVFGDSDKIFYSLSDDGGSSFSKPELIGQVSEMHLGMTRGPQLASSKDYSVVTAMDKKGNIHSFILTHRTGKWEKIQNVNDTDASAPEGLMSVAADDNNNFYAVWLDLREGRKNNICFSSLKGKTAWTKNVFIYKSPESHVCECCKPSVAVRGDNVSVMFRNWLNGSRDLYLLTSSNKGKNFSDATKLGVGTWPLKGCPMDGGGVTVDARNNIHTAWQRDGIVYYSQPDKPEVKVGEGRSVRISGTLITWQNGSELIVHPLHGQQKIVGEGTALMVLPLKDNSILAFWEKDGEILFKKL
jgi:hypothetical protein